MANSASNQSGSTVGNIKTPMSSANVGKNNEPTIQKTKGMPDTKGGSSIKGPGKEGSWKK